MASEAEGYHEWLRRAVTDTGSVGLRGWALVVATVPVTLFAAMLGSCVFPPGYYPRLVLALPGLLAGGLFVYVFGWFVRAAPVWISGPLSLFLAFGATWEGLELLVAGM